MVAQLLHEFFWKLVGERHWLHSRLSWSTQIELKYPDREWILHSVWSFKQRDVCIRFRSKGQAWVRWHRFSLHKRKDVPHGRVVNNQFSSILLIGLIDSDSIYQLSLSKYSQSILGLGKWWNWSWLIINEGGTWVSVRGSCLATGLCGGVLLTKALFALSSCT